MHPRVSVGALLDAVGPAVLTALWMPDGRAQQLGSPVLDDGNLSNPLVGSTVILIGRPSPTEIERAARASASAVIVRATETSAKVLAAAGERAGITVLAANEKLSWGEVYSLVRTMFTMYETRDEGRLDLFELADSVARDAGGAVAIEDMGMRVVAYSSIPGQDIDELRADGILGRRVPEHAVQAEEYLAVLRAERAVWCHEPRDNAPRLAIGVQAHGQSYGTIWVIQGDTPLNARAPEILADAARRAVPQLAKISFAGDARRHLRNDLLGRLLRGIGPMEKLAAEVGLPVRGPFDVVAFGAFGALGSPADELDTGLVADMVRNVLDSYRIRAAVGVHDGHGYAVVAGEPDSSLWEDLIRETLSRASERHGETWRAGASRVLTDIRRLPEGAEQAHDVLLALSSGSDESLAFARHREMSAALVLHAVGTCSRLSVLLRDEPLATVLRHDDEYGSEYAKTLREWIKRHYDVPTAAAALFVHPNTLRHRLNRMRDLFDLDDPDLRLVLALQLRMHASEVAGAATA
ncbi:hypothetical protein CQ044_02130 [Microbacterium sp. MYb64]|nr:hypothetical protein CQ044_02130 [Microbacterium sp. MYb64]